MRWSPKRVWERKVGGVASGTWRWLGSNALFKKDFKDRVWARAWRHGEGQRAALSPHVLQVEAVEKAPQRPGVPETSAGELEGRGNGRASLAGADPGRHRTGQPLWPLAPAEGSGSPDLVHFQTHPLGEAGILSLGPGLSGTQRWVFPSVGEANSCEQTSGHAGQVGAFPNTAPCFWAGGLLPAPDFGHGHVTCFGQGDVSAHACGPIGGAETYFQGVTLPLSPPPSAPSQPSKSFPCIPPPTTGLGAREGERT